MAQKTQSRAVDNALDLADALEQRDDVESTMLDADWTPPRVVVHLAEPEIPAVIEDMAEKHHARLVDAAIEDDALVVTYAVPEPLRNVGVHKLRKHGAASVVITLAPLAVETSGFAEGVQVEQLARDDEIVLRRW